MIRSSYQRRCDQKGLSSLELLVALAVAAPLFTLLLQSISLTGRVIGQIKTRRSSLTGEHAGYRAFEQVMRDLDSHPFQILPRTHGNLITFTDSTPLRVRGRDQQSSAITSTHLSMPHLLAVESSRDNALLGCPVASESIALKTDLTLHSVVVLAPDGLYEAVVQDITRLPDGCYRLVVSLPARSMSTIIPTHLSLSFARYLVPVRWIQTVFRDTDQRLRMIRHAGERILLNQPIESGVPAYRLRLAFQPVTGQVELAVRVTDALPLHFSHLIPRTNFRHILWNLTDAKLE